jgi:hypothetical protein
MTGLMSATSVPDKWMTMSVSISSGGFNCLLNFRPSFKAATFERERAQRLPPRLDQVEIGSILRLKDELPTRMLQTKRRSKKSGGDSRNRAESEEMEGRLRQVVLPLRI